MVEEELADGMLAAAAAAKPRASSSAEAPPEACAGAGGGGGSGCSSRAPAPLLPALSTGSDAPPEVGAWAPCLMGELPEWIAWIFSSMPLPPTASIFLSTSSSSSSSSLSLSSSSSSCMAATAGSFLLAACCIVAAISAREAETCRVGAGGRATDPELLAACLEDACVLLLPAPELAAWLDMDVAAAALLLDVPNLVSMNLMISAR